MRVEIPNPYNYTYYRKIFKDKKLAAETIAKMPIIREETLRWACSVLDYLELPDSLFVKRNGCEIVIGHEKQKVKSTKYEKCQLLKLFNTSPLLDFIIFGRDTRYFLSRDEEPSNLVMKNRIYGLYNSLYTANECNNITVLNVLKNPNNLVNFFRTSSDGKFLQMEPILRNSAEISLDVFKGETPFGGDKIEDGRLLGRSVILSTKCVGGLVSVEYRWDNSKLSFADLAAAFSRSQFSVIWIRTHVDIYGINNGMLTGLTWFVVGHGDESVCLEAIRTLEELKDCDG